MTSATVPFLNNLFGEAVMLETLGEHTRNAAGHAQKNVKTIGETLVTLPSNVVQHFKELIEAVTPYQDFNRDRLENLRFLISGEPMSVDIAIRLVADTAEETGRHVERTKNKDARTALNSALAEMGVESVRSPQRPR
jgi:hypothetical protein